MNRTIPLKIGSLLLLVCACTSSTQYVLPTSDKALAANPNLKSYTYTAKGCERLRNTSRFWGSMAIGASSLAGGTGISTVTVSHANEKNALALTTAALAAVAAASSYIGSDVGEERKAHTECY